MDPSENKRLLERFNNEVINAKRYDVIYELIADDIVEHEQAPGLAPGPSGLEDFFRGYHEAFPDLEVTTEELLAEGDQVAVRLTIRGTHRGEYLGVPATGRKICVDYAAFVRFSGGKIVEHWGLTDRFAMLTQFEAI